MRATTIEGQNAFLQRCALRKFLVTDGQKTRDQITSNRSPNARDQSAFYAFLTFLVEFQRNAGYIHATNA